MIVGSRPAEGPSCDLSGVYCDRASSAEEDIRLTRIDRGEDPDASQLVRL